MITEAEGRRRVVAEALTWLGTPWRHRAKIKGVGVDCGQFPLAVYVGAGLIEDFSTGAYAQDHMLHSIEERYLGIVRRLAGEITADQVKPGDLAVYKFGRVFSHGALVIRWPQVIHPLINAGAVVLGDADRDVDLITKPVRFFSHWAKGAVHGG